MNNSPDHPSPPADLPRTTLAMMRRARARPLKDIPPEDPTPPEDEG